MSGKFSNDLERFRIITTAKLTDLPARFTGPPMGLSRDSRVEIGLGFTKWHGAIEQVLIVRLRNSQEAMGSIEETFECVTRFSIMTRSVAPFCGVDCIRYRSISSVIQDHVLETSNLAERRPA